MKHFIYQGNEHDCGFASLKMLLATLSNNDSYLYLRKPNKKENFTLQDIINIAKMYGLILNGYTCDYDYLNKIKYPCLTLINGNHLLMIKKITKNRILVYDPDLGKKWYKKDQFNNVWNKIILEAENENEIQKIKIKRYKILPNKFKFLNIISLSISLLSLIFLFFFFNDKENIVYSFFFLMVFFTSQFFENFLLYKQINYFDEQYIPSYFLNSKNKNKQSYINFLDFKRDYFVNSRSLLSSLFLTITITFLLFFNDFKNVLILVVLLLLKTLEILCFSKISYRSSEKIGILEKTGLTDENKTIDNLLLANKQSNKIVFNESIRNLFYMIFCFLFALLMAKITNNFECNYVIFHFVFYYMGYKSISELLYKTINKNKLFKLKCEFIDKCNL